MDRHRLSVEIAEERSLFERLQEGADAQEAEKSSKADVPEAHCQHGCPGGSHHTHGTHDGEMR